MLGTVVQRLVPELRRQLGFGKQGCGGVDDFRIIMHQCSTAQYTDSAKLAALCVVALACNFL